MSAPAVLEPRAAGVAASIGADGRLLVRPASRITAELDVYLRRHRIELMAALTSAELPGVVAVFPGATVKRRRSPAEFERHWNGRRGLNPPGHCHACGGVIWDLQCCPGCGRVTEEPP